MVYDPDHDPDEVTATQRRHPTAYLRPERPPTWLVLCDRLLLEREQEREEDVEGRS